MVDSVEAPGAVQGNGPAQQADRRNTPSAEANLRLQAETYLVGCTMRGGPHVGEININKLAERIELLRNQPGGKAIIDAIMQKLQKSNPAAGEKLRCHLQSGENYPPSWTGAAGNAVSMTRDWVAGTGPENCTFGPRSDAAMDMKTSPGVERAREFFYKKNAKNIAEGKPLVPVTNYSAGFGLQGAWESGSSPTQQFVGNFRVDINPVNRNGCNYLQFTLTNNSSMQSFLYGIGPHWERPSFGPGGDMWQTYTWEESVR